MPDLQDQVNDFIKNFPDMEKRLGIPKGFLIKLENEDDWSFIIKAHSLVEAAITHLLIQATNDARLKKVYARLELSNGTTGKLAFIKALDLIDDKQRKFIIKFSELRNNLVHDIQNITFTFDDHIQSLDTDQQKSWKKTFGYYAQYHEGENQKKWYDMTLSKPKFVIWWGLIGIITQSYALGSILQKEFEQKDRAKVFLDEHLDQICELTLDILQD